jgi:hypothetical protein
MGASLPLVLLAYRRNEPRTILVLTAITALFLYPRLFGHSLINQSYAPQYTLTRFLETWQSYVGELLYRHSPLPLLALILILVTLVLGVILLRSKPLLFCMLFILIAPLPLCFVEPRGLSVYYIPFAAWAIYAAVLIGERQPALRFGVLAVLLCLLFVKDRPYRFYPGDGKSELIRGFEADIAAVQPSIANGTRILLRNDPFDGNEWTPVSLLQLYYRERDLEVDRAKLIPPSKAYGVIFDYQNGHVVKVQ